MPSTRLIISAALANREVITLKAGTRRRSAVTESCKLHDEQHPVEMGEEALRPLLAVGDEADRLAFQGGKPRRELTHRRDLFGRGIENTESHGVPQLFLWRFAIDTGADRQRDGMALVAEPWRDNGAEAARRSAGGDDQEL